MRVILWSFYSSILLVNMESWCPVRYANLGAAAVSEERKTDFNNDFAMDICIR